MNDFFYQAHWARHIEKATRDGAPTTADEDLRDLASMAPTPYPLAQNAPRKNNDATASGPFPNVADSNTTAQCGPQLFLKSY